MTLSNSAIAELLTRESATATDHLQRALRRASRRAFLWPEEASHLLEQGRSLTELTGIGPRLSAIIEAWLEHPPTDAQPPAVRAGFLTLAEARSILADHPDWAPRCKGDLQSHTEWSDGGDSVRTMAEAAAARGYEYLAITDHAKGLRIAGGIDERELSEQTVEIQAVNEAVRNAHPEFRLLRSIELNLTPEGSGDMDPDALRELDLVLGCFHSALRRTDDQTDRYLAALRNASVHILGHPRGRMYGRRPGLNADWDRVFALATELDKAIEVDCFPDRQDLSVDLLEKARGAGCRISLGTDAHGAAQLAFIEFGLAATIAARIEPERMLNFMKRDDLVAWARSHRTR